MKRKGAISKWMAILLSLILLMPVMPIFAEDEENLSEEGLVFNYDILYDGPFSYQIDFFEDIVVTLEAQGVMQGKWPPNLPWMPIPDSMYIQWSAADGQDLVDLGITLDNGVLTIPPTAGAGTFELKAKIKQPGFIMTHTLYTETFTFELTKRIPRIQFVNPEGDFDLWIPYGDGTQDINYTVEVVDQYDQVIEDLTPVLMMMGTSNDHMLNYYTSETHHLHLYGNPGYAGEIYLHAYIQEFGELDSTMSNTTPIHSIDKTILISKEEDQPYYGILTGMQRIAIPETDSVTEVYQYEIYSQYDVLLEGYGDLADFWIPENQPAEITVDQEAQTLSVTVPSTAPHSYLWLRVGLMDELGPVETDQEIEEPEAPTPVDWEFGWEGKRKVYIYLDKTVYGEIDDYNNLMVFGDDQDQNLEFRIVANYPDEPLIQDAGRGYDSWMEGWRDFDPDYPQVFPGKMDVEFRYKNNYRWEPEAVIESDLALACRPKAYDPGEAKSICFTVVMPEIITSPTNPNVGNTVTVTLNYKELYPGFELVPGDLASDLYWYDPDGVPYIALKSMWYKLGETGDWLRYNDPFTITSNTTIFGKTIVMLDMAGQATRATSDYPEWVDYSGDYTSSFAEKTVIFNVPAPQEPEPEPEPEPETQAPTQPVTQAETEPIPEPTFGPPVPFNEPETEIEELTVAQGALDEAAANQAAGSDLVFNEVVTPLGDATLPQTNELPITLLYGLGILISGAGAMLLRRKED